MSGRARATRAARRLARLGASGPVDPLAHVSDDQLFAAMDRIRRGEPSGIEPRVPAAMLQALADLSDEELTRRANAAVTRLCGSRNLQHGGER